MDGLLAYYGRQEHRSLPSVTSQLKARTALGETRALAVTTLRLDRIIGGWQEAGAKSTTINRRLSLLRRAYRLAKLRLDPVRLDFSDVFVAETSSRGRYLTGEAFAAIYRNLRDYLQDLFEFSYLVGTRKGQLTRTRWAHWNPEPRELTWTGAEVKAKADFVLPLDGRPLELIVARHAQRRLHCHVFHGPHCGVGHQPSTHYGCVGDFEGVDHGLQEGGLPCRSLGRRLRVPQHAPHGRDQSRQRGRPGARGDGCLGPPHPQRL